MNLPLITIFIPTYKRPQLLQKAIESAQNQTFKNIQVLICDNASNDETAKIVARLAKKDPRIVYFCHPDNIGMLANYDFGISRINTKYFSILSDDDLLLPCFCETALQGFSEYPDVAFFACSSLMINKERKVFRAPMNDWPREGRFCPPEGFLQMIGKYPVPTTTMFLTETAAKAKIDYNNIVAWDCDFLLQIASRHPFAISKRTCGYYISHPNSFSGVLTFPASLKSIRLLSKRVQEFPWIEPSLAADAKELLRQDYCKTALIHLVHLFAIKRYRGGILTCFKLLAHGYRGKKVFIFIFMCGICYFLPFMHRFFTYLQKLKAIHSLKKDGIDYTTLKDVSQSINIDLPHFEKKSKTKFVKSGY